MRGRTDHLTWYRTDEAAAEVVFLHGFTDSAQCWDPVIRALPGVRTLAIDARGHGESGLPDEPIRYTAHRDDAALVLSDQPENGGVVVVGHSMGAMAAAYLAASRPDLVRAVVLEDPPTGAPGNHQDEPWSEPEWLAELRALELPDRIARGRANDPGWPDDELEPWAVSKGQVNPHLFDLTFQQAGPLTELLAAITCPVLLIHGDTDRGGLISPEYAEQCAQAAAGEFHAVHIPEAGHSVHRDNRPRYLAELTAFLTHHDPKDAR
ncbi:MULTISPECIES: alpha/beta fold hydrolase [Kribbella]